MNETFESKSKKVKKNLKNSILDIKKIENISISKKQHQQIISVENEKSLVLPVTDQLNLFDIKATTEEKKQGFLERGILIKVNKSLQKCKIVIRPAFINGSFHFFNKRDEAIFDILRYFSCMKNTSVLKNKLIGTNFSVGAIQKYLKSINKTMSRKQINESLDSLKINLIEFHTPISVTKFNLIDSFTVMNDGKLYVSLSHIIQSDLEKDKYNFCFMPKELFCIKSSEARHIALQMILFFKQAGSGEYNLKLNYIYASVHRNLDPNSKRGLSYIKKACDELIKLEFIKSCRYKPIYDSNDKRKISNYIFYFKASDKLIKSIKASNFLIKENKENNQKELPGIINKASETYMECDNKKEEETIIEKECLRKSKENDLSEELNNFWKPSEMSIRFLIDQGISKEFIDTKTSEIQLYFYEKSRSRKKPTEARYRKWIKDDWEIERNKSSYISVNDFTPSKEVREIPFYKDRFAEFKLYYSEVGEFRTSEQWQALFLKKNPIESSSEFIDPKDWSKGKIEVYRWKK